MSLVNYDLFMLIQSIVNKQIVNIQIPQPLYTPTGWNSSFSSFLSQTHGGITTTKTLPQDGSYNFQVDYTVQITPGQTTYNAVAFEFRLYYSPVGTPINYTKSPFIPIATHQLDDPTAEGVINSTNVIQLINSLHTNQLALGYWVGSTQPIGTPVNITLTINSVSFSFVSTTQTATPL